MTLRTVLCVPVAIALGIVLVAAGCGDDGASPNGGALDGDYIAVNVTEDGAPRALVEGTTIRLRIDDKTLSVRAGCNSIGGEFTLDDRVLRVGAVSMTEMGCDPPRHDQDAWLARFLSSTPMVHTVDDGFTLRSGVTEITFIDAAIVHPDVALVGPTWVVDGYIEGPGPDGAASSASDAGSIVFGQNGFVTGHDGCNSFGYAGQPGTAPTQGLRYEISEDEIVFTGSAVTTAIACPGRDTARFWAVLSGTVTWQVDGSRLTLRDRTGGGVTYAVQG